MWLWPVQAFLCHNKSIHNIRVPWFISVVPLLTPFCYSRVVVQGSSRHLRTKLVLSSAPATWWKLSFGFSSFGFLTFCILLRNTNLNKIHLSLSSEVFQSFMVILPRHDSLPWSHCFFAKPHPPWSSLQYVSDYSGPELYRWWRQYTVYSETHLLKSSLEVMSRDIKCPFAVSKDEAGNTLLDS